MKRLFSHRYPFYGENHDGMGKIALIGASVLTVFTGIITLNKWKKSEQAKRSIEKYEAIDPNSIIPLPKNFHSIDPKKLLKAVTEGGDKFISDELGRVVFSAPEEYVYYTTKGIQSHEREQFLEFVRDKISKIRKS